MKLEYMRLVNYVECASNLAEGIAHDIKNGSRVSSGSKSNLIKFYAAARGVQMLMDAVEIDKKDIQ